MQYNRGTDIFAPNECTDFKRERQKLKLILLYHRSEVGNSAEMVDRRREIRKYSRFSHRFVCCFTRENMCPRDVKTGEMCEEFVVECGYLECGTQECLWNAIKR